MTLVLLGNEYNCFFTKQCSTINNSGEFPSSLCKKTDKSISAITFTSDDIATLIQNLDPNKAYGHDILNICMLKLCSKSICKPLNLIFQSCIKYGEFPTEWEKKQVFLYIKKWQTGFKKLSACIFTSICRKSLNTECTIDCVNISLRTNSSLQTNLVLSQGICVSISCYL